MTHLSSQREWVRGTFRLRQLDDKTGQVTDERTGRVFPPTPLVSVLARGYWEEVPQLPPHPRDRDVTFDV